MARLSPEEIFRAAMQAGFNQHQATTMTAIAMAESGGNTDAHNPSGEDSWGLWQINKRAHTHLANVDLTDPVANARAAYEVSRQGGDIRPWTVTHADKGSPYLQHRAAAEEAARANGYPDATGQWDPPQNYHDDAVPAGPPGDAPPPSGVVAEAPEPAVEAVPVVEAPPALDSSGDGLMDAYKEQLGLDPRATDTDRDGFSDRDELFQGTNPLDFSDNPLVGPGEGAPDMGVPLTTEVPGPGAAPPPTAQPIAAAQPQPAGPQPLAGQSLAGGQPTATATALAAPPDPVTVEETPLDTFLDAALSQEGATYVFGAPDEDFNDPNPMSDGVASYDCSSLIRWAAAQAGVEITDGSWLQYLELSQKGAEITVEEALNTPGALLFNFSSEPVPGGGRPSSAHVAISLGDGRTMEARNPRAGVGVWDNAESREWSHAAVIPDLGTDLSADLLGLDGAVIADPLPMLPPAELPEIEPLDFSPDGLLAEYKEMLGLDPFSADTDRDGIVDSYELLYGSDPLDFADNPLVGAGGLDLGVPLSTADDGFPGADADDAFDDPFADPGDAFSADLDADGIA